MTPTPEQLEAVVKALIRVDAPRDADWLSDADLDSFAQAAWSVIAPIVRAQALEEAAREAEQPKTTDTVVDDYERMAQAFIAARIRALK